VTKEINLLKEQLQIRTGIALDSILGCKLLDAWLKLRGVYISYSTLSRVFGLARLTTQPRERTLDELASILGFTNFKDFVFSVNTEHKSPIVPFELQFAFEMSLAQRKLKQAALIYLEMVNHSSESKVFSKDLANAIYREANSEKHVLTLLASSSIGRESFFLTFIDEDDLKGTYRKSLNEFFLPNSTETERQFVELYSLRKDVLSLEQLKWKDSSALELDSLKNIHLKARALELLLIRTRNERLTQRKSEVLNLTDRAFLLFCESSNKVEELAVLGRFARGALYSGSSNYILEHRGIIKAMLSLLNQKIVDFEFQIPIYALLNKLNSLKETSIPQASSWPNAYYSSAVFLLKTEERKSHELFFNSKVGIHKSFLYAY